MQSPWGDIRVCDSHIHFFSHQFFTLLSGQKPGLSADAALGLLKWQKPPEDPRALAAEWVAELDRCGVARAALIASLPGDLGSVQQAVLAFPDRLRGYAMIHPLMDGAAESVRSALAKGGLHGLCFFPAMHGYYMYDPRARAIVEEAANHPGTVVFVHCGVLSVGVRQKLDLASPFDMRYSNPLDLHSTALAFPQIRFVLPHFGAGFFREALMLCDQCPNVYLDTSSSNRWTLYEGLDLRTVFTRALQVAGPSRVVFGTDSSFFPRGWQQGVFQAQTEVLAAAGLDGRDAEAIFSGNFDRLFF